MKYERTERFKRDYKDLAPEHRRKLAAAARKFHAAAVRAAAGADRPWPSSLRVKPVESASGIWEMTWSKDHPDGRATWEWTTIHGEPAVRWRRVGDHRVLDDA